MVAGRDERVEIWRRGPITGEQLGGSGVEQIFDRQDDDATNVREPGKLTSHYAPKTPLRLINNAESFSPEESQRVGLLAWNPTNKKKFAAVRHLSEEQDFREAAANLFRYLRELDALGLDLIVAERVPSQGLGPAIFDRLRRAEHGRQQGLETPEGTL